ncbi:WecB/TagA/CpsF family glycosyltransferase [Oxalicibacterium faecigallinarum]|uniref:GumM protein n=1 Tax=Oxalicibacterium faecigallinarum TaxID=573741 RepID=A0A8J3ANK9_9BURK|nr:WecB/TagA/CpsF family glycosyltransferase [Oxalicibacterium faecigallinarum]GGI16050.1 GumM protein [Oxalicibacterium faecigallinarum]
MTNPSVLSIADFPVRVLTADILSDGLLQVIAQREKIALFFANTNFIMQCRALLPRMQDDGVVIVNDGIGLNLASWMVHGRQFPENLNGTDFTPLFLSRAERPLRIFLLGGRPRALAKAEEHVRSRLGQQVVGRQDGYGDLNHPELIERINQARPDLVLVALGNPIQERWILDNHPQLHVPVMMGVGALFDFWAGEKSRAPKLVQRLKLEWLYRLALEPRRLMRRYTVDVIAFFMLCYRRRRQGGHV